MIPNPKDKILVLISDPQVNYLLDRVLKSVGYSVTLCQDIASAEKIFSSPLLPTLMVISDRTNDGDGVDYAAQVLGRFPSLPVLLFVHQDTPELLRRAMRAGINDYMCLPLRADDILKAVQNCFERSRKQKEAVLLETRRHTSSLQRRMDETDTLSRLGRSITSSLDLDSVLAAIVDASVELTGAEEGSLLLLDEATGELYMRAARNFKEEFVRTFRLPIKDTLAGSVLRSGQPVLLDENAPQKIKTSYLVHSLVYVPLQLKDHVFGVLGVDNRHSHVPFNEHHVKLLSALAEYAVVAIQNAGLYQSVNAERNKFETVLARIHDGVIVMDHDRRILLVNQEASQALGLQESQWSNRLIQDIITQSELIDLVNSAGHSLSDRTEVSLEDGRVFSAMLAPIPEVGMAITLHDITNLKKLDRIKSDFVNTVSHDLRSPLTAILGYAELVERAGPVNDLQRDFIQRVQVSVHNITMLVDDLLNLGRIEAGFDSRNEKVVLPQIVEFSAEGFQKSLHDKDVQLQVQLPADFPVLYGNPVQLRQMVDNLLDNAIKYTPRGGQIRIQGTREENQIILQFSDTGMGIPTLDLPYIFDKFYRASNASAEVTGSGLGLSIVRSIVENHQGRIWVNSTVNAGTTFTVVLPLPEQ